MSKKMQLSWFQVIFFISAFFYVAASQDEYEDMGGVPYFSGSSLGEYPIGPIHRARRAQVEFLLNSTDKKNYFMNTVLE